MVRSGLRSYYNVRRCLRLVFFSLFPQVATNCFAALIRVRVRYRVYMYGVWIVWVYFSLESPGRSTGTSIRLNVSALCRRAANSSQVSFSPWPASNKNMKRRINQTLPALNLPAPPASAVRTLLASNQQTARRRALLSYPRQ